MTSRRQAEAMGRRQVALLVDLLEQGVVPAYGAGEALTRDGRWRGAGRRGGRPSGNAVAPVWPPEERNGRRGGEEWRAAVTRAVRGCRPGTLVVAAVRRRPGDAWEVGLARRLPGQWDAESVLEVPGRALWTGTPWEAGRAWEGLVVAALVME